MDIDGVGFFSFTDSREAAFVYAISAAGVAYSVTRACSRGELTDCSCDNRVRARHPNHWEWGGCSEVNRSDLLVFFVHFFLSLVLPSALNSFRRVSFQSEVSNFWGL